MSKTLIEWTDKTWNPIRGTIGRWHCTHVSEGCRNCYAERMNRRWGGPEYTPGADKFRLDPNVLGQPRHWRKPCKVFVCDMTDLFHENIEDNWLMEIFWIMGKAPQHTFQILTKRPARMLAFVSRVLKGITDCHHIWLGVSVEDQQTADERIPLLLQTPAAVRFVSYEPALGPVDFTRLRDGTFNALDGIDFEDIGDIRDPGFPSRHQPASLDWLIIGGESGPQARPFDLAWARSVIAQCQAAKVPLFVKQLGAHPMDVPPPPPEKQYAPGERPGQSWRLLLHHKKGGDLNEWPKDLRIREWPA